MTDTLEQFARYAREHARLYDPVVYDDEVQLIRVDLDLERPRPRRKKRRGKKDRPSTALNTGKKPETAQGNNEASAQQAKSVQARMVDPLFWLPPSHYPRVLDTEEQAASLDAVPQTDEPRGKPRISFEPKTRSLDIPLFNDQAFQVHAPRAEKVSLIWQRAGSTAFEHVEMEHKSQGLFEALVGIDDGDYLITFEVDGLTRPDPRYSQRIVVRSDGIFAPMNLSQRESTVVLKNAGRQDESVRIESDSRWLVADSEVRVLAGARAETTIRFRSERMQEGKNEAVLTASVSREGKPVFAASSAVEVNLTAGGAVPEVCCRPSVFGWIAQGEGRIEFEVEVNVRGRGPLNGMIFLGHPGEAADFRIEAGGNGSVFTRKFTIDSLDLPHRADGSLKITLVSDCFLANYRSIELRLPYRLVYLQKSLPALTFGKVRQGMTRALRLEVARSDGKQFELDVTVPESARSYLQAFRARADAYSFMFDTRGLKAGHVVQEVVTLADSSSGLRDQIKVLAEVISDRAQAVGVPERV